MESVEQRVVDQIVSEFDELIKKPEIYMELQHEKFEGFEQIAKKIFALSINSNLITDLKTKALSKLLVEGFDEEQIWQQIEIQNKGAAPHISKIIAKISSDDISFLIGITNTSLNEDGALSDEDSNIEQDFIFDNDSVSSTDLVKSAKKTRRGHEKEEYAFDDDSDSSTDVFRDVKVADDTKNGKFTFDDDGNSDSSADMVLAAETENNLKEQDYDSDSSINKIKPAKEKKNPRKKLSTFFKSVVDDQFFKLSKLEEYLKIEDLKEGKEATNESDDDGDIDLFQDIPSDEYDEESEDENEKKLSKDIMYEDFFDAPDSGSESNRTANGDKEDDCDLESASDGEMEDNESDTDTRNIEQEHNLQTEDTEIPFDNTTHKSAFELEQEKIRKRIQECEQNMLQPLPWDLTGEVAASSRPIDSLIEKETDFDSNVKQDFIVDNDITEKVQTIIKMAIINKAFCDVERKIKPTEEVIAYKKEMVLDQTKSKKSLAQVYEEDYLKKQTKQEEEEDPKHKEIKKLMDSLFPELHALFSHIPKPAIPDIKIVSNLPAITVEEVAPTSVSDVTMLAPEEVKEKSGLIKGETERTDTDRKRERRKKKVHQRLKEKKKMEKLEAQKANPSAKLSKLEKLETLKKLKQKKNTKIANIDDGSRIKSSKDFFSRLQDTMDSKIKRKTQVPYKKKNS